MLLKFFFNHLNILFISCCLSSVKSENMTLELIHVIFRHGLRSPSDVEAKYLEVNDSSIYGPEGFGQLTNEGKRQVYRLGYELRRKYDKFLGEYKHDEIHPRSTDQPRTKMSLQLLLASLYPPSLDNKWNKVLDWNAIPYYYTPHGLDVTLAPFNCPNFPEYYKNILKTSDEFKKSISNFTNFIDYMTEKTGIEIRQNLTYHVGWIWIAVKIHKTLDLPVPTWCTDDVVETLNKFVHISIRSMCLTYDLRRLNSGPLIKKILENIDENNKADKPKKIYLYSVHDLNLLAFTEAHNISTIGVPPFGSAIIVEKYRDNENQEYIRFVSWDGTNFGLLNNKNCEEFCHLKKYKKMVEGLIPTDADFDFLLGKKKEL